MAKIWLDYSDGRYYTRLLTEDEANENEAKGLDVVHLEDNLWEAYRRDCERDAIWQAFWRSISNEQYMRRREKALLPLEEADREITRLKSELERAQRSATYFENEWSRAVHGHERRSREHTCVYPQPGCQIEALPEEWRGNAQKILSNFRADRMEDGLKYQGCCCSYGNHRLLDDAEAQRLRAAGFLVENDTEYDSE